VAQPNENVSEPRRLLIVGGGGREHALADKLSRDAPDAQLFAAPGNPGIAELARLVPIGVEELDELAGFAEREAIDLTVVGPEVPLAAGIADLFAARGLPLFGPTAGAARLEASKAFSKRLMRERDVPTAEFETFTDAGAALDYLNEGHGPIVVKASGLAAGKGALVCEDRRQAREAIQRLMIGGQFGDAGREVVIEEHMQGPELSTFFLADGETAVPLVPSRDYKRAEDGDRGLNTGGMGAYSPAGPPGEPPTPELIDHVREIVVSPVLEGLSESGSPYRGFLYAGLMLTDEGPKVVEFNCRLGDPEAQVVLPLTRSNLLEPLMSVARGEGLGSWRDEPGPGSALVTVLASGGYPGSYDTGHQIHMPEDGFDEQVRVYHAGTGRDGDRLVTAGGRVLAVTGIGADLEEAARLSQAAADSIRFEGKHWRRDIGWHDRPTAGGAR
jgi:phosphoribosylamine--glycine ligase